MKELLITILVFSFLPAFSQSKWHPYGGIHISTDAEAFYIGPSFQLGVDYMLKKRFSVTAYLYYFLSTVDDEYNGSLESGRYKSTTLAVLLQRHLSKHENRGWFIAAGIALQKTKDDYITAYSDEHLRHTVIIPAIRFGYKFPIKQHGFAIEINGTGPYISGTGPAPYYEQEVDILTQLSFGVRFVL